MAQIADSLTEKMQTLSPEQLAEVERFVESLQGWEQEHALRHAWASVSEASFKRVWDNPDDEVYDAL